MSKRILITGVSGFIGLALAAHLCSRKKYKVLGVDVKASRMSGVRFTKIDLLDRKAFALFLRREKPQVIFHLAGGRFADVQAMYISNVMTTAALFETIACVKGYHPRVVVMGSAAEYGACSGPRLITEEMPGRIDSDYGALKLLQTTIALYFSRVGEDVVVARLFNVLGPGLPVHTAGGKFARDIVMAERGLGPSVISTGDLRGIRDFLDIRDVCSALLLLAERGRSGEIYNICSQRGVVMKDLLRQMIALSGKTGLEHHQVRRRSAGVLSSVGLCAKLKKDTAWRPRYTFRQSLKATLDHYRRKDASFL
jgi:GDP-4-dehydro-6-deoxy-D-mannose reductase